MGEIPDGMPSGTAYAAVIGSVPVTVRQLATTKQVTENGHGSNEVSTAIAAPPGSSVAIVDRGLTSEEETMTATASATNPIDAATARSDGFPVIFLPGIVMPAALRYARLIQELGNSTRALVKELEVYAAPTSLAGYGIACEVDGISRAADAAGFDRFHLYGHSAGGACALAYVAAHPDRVLSLALDEPATDCSAEDLSALRKELNGITGLSAGEKLSAFLRQQLAPGVEPPSLPAGSPPEWMASRPAGIDAFVRALIRYRLPSESLRAFGGPVYYSHGSLSHPRWAAMRDRLASVFPDFTADLYEGVHHLETSHQREPARVASALRRLWSRAEEERRRPSH
jgi:pimeloyl-ACP methyl ester carboxylesterase